MSPGHSEFFLQLSDEQLQRLQFGREQCRIIMFHVRYLISHLPSLVNVEEFPAAIRTIEESVLQLSEKSFPWCLLRQESIRQNLFRVKSDLMLLFVSCGLDADTLETDFIKAQQQDRENLRTRCRSLSRSPDLSSHLVAAAGNRYQPQELLKAFTKHINSLPHRHVTDDVDEFIRTAAAALRHNVGTPPSDQTPSWCLTSLDVDFDIHSEKELVGRGAFGRVVKGKWWKGATKEVVAVKGLYVKSGEEADKRRALESFKNEVRIWSLLSHPNILPFLGASFDSTIPFIISELCPAGHALLYLRSNPTTNRVRLLLDTLLALIYLHSVGIVHGDVKATNILVSTSEEKPRALLTDFGLSIVYDSSSPATPHPLSRPENSPDSTSSSSSSSNPGQSSFFKSITHTKRPQIYQPVGTPRWMAPEVIRGKGLSTAGDVYGFGMVGWELLSVRSKAGEDDAEQDQLPDPDTYRGLPLPFGSVKDPNVVCQLVVRGERPKRPPRGRSLQNQSDEDKVWEMIEQCWKPHPVARPDFRWVERVLRGVLKRTEERIEGKRNKWSLDLSSAALWPWKKASTDNAVGVTVDVPPTPSPNVVENANRVETPIVSPPPRPRRKSILKTLVNLNILTFPKSPSSATGTKHFEWYSRGRDPRKSHNNCPPDPNPSSTSFDNVVASARALPSISRSSSLSRSNSQTRKLRRRRRTSEESRHGPTKSEDPCSRVDPEKDIASHTAVLMELFNLSLTSEGGSEIIRDGNIIPAMLVQLKCRLEEVAVDKVNPAERPLTSGILANLACHGHARVYLIVQSDLIPALMSCLSLSESAQVHENATRCLYNLSTSSQSHRLFVPRHGEEGFIFSMAKLLLSDTFSLNTARNVFGCFTNLSHKEMGGSAILATPEALDALVRTLILPGHPEDIEEVAKEQALMCLGNLSVDEKGIIAVLSHPDLIGGLSKSLTNSRNCHPIKAQALRCSRNIARSASDHAEILREKEITAAVSDVLGAFQPCASDVTPRAVSSHERRYALHFVHRMSGSASGRAWLRKEMHTEEYSGVREGLRWLAEHGTADERVRAGECLRVSEIAS